MSESTSSSSGAASIKPEELSEAVVREGLTTEELRSLKSGEPLNNESLRKVTGKLTGNPRMGIKLANSLRPDFSGTMEQLFELTPDEKESVYMISQERSDSIDLIAQFLTEAFKQGSAPQIQISKKLIPGSGVGATARNRKVKCKLTAMAKCPVSNPEDCEFEGGVELNFW